MRQGFQNDFVKVVNWRGVHGKTPFQSLQPKNIVIEAVRRTPVCAQTSELEVEKGIKRWFHLAGDRKGGRKKRRTPFKLLGNLFCIVATYNLNFFAHLYKLYLIYLL